MDWMILAHIGDKGYSLLSVLIQMLISARNTLRNKPRNVLPAIWASLGLVMLTHKINYHSHLDHYFLKQSYH